MKLDNFHMTTLKNGYCEIIFDKPLTEKQPKCLVKVGEITILEGIIDPLLANRIDKIVITTGPYEGMIKRFVKEKYPQLQVVYVRNPIYTKTNYIYSLWLARGDLKNDDVLYFHGDLYFDPCLIKKILAFPHSGALIQKDFVPKKDFKAMVEDGLIKKIGVDVFGQGAGFCLPIYKFLENDWQKWMGKMNQYIKKGKTDCYAENAFNEISDQIKLYPVYFQKEYGMEIDDFDDLKKAKELCKIR